METLELPALGRSSARLGAFYDAAADRFVPGSKLFCEALVEDQDYDSTDCPDTTIKCKTSDSFEDKCDAMDIKGEIKLSVAMGLVRDQFKSYI